MFSTYVEELLHQCIEEKRRKLRKVRTFLVLTLFFANDLTFCVNCNCKPLGSEAYRLAWKMAKARTSAQYWLAYKDLYIANQYCAEWLHARREMFASYILLVRRSIVTTNPVEQFNRVMLEARGAPITEALLMLLCKIGKTTVERYE